MPLDWLEPTEEQRVVLAVIRLEAKNKDDYRGPVFINPGVGTSLPFAIALYHTVLKIDVLQRVLVVPACPSRKILGGTFKLL